LNPISKTSVICGLSCSRLQIGGDSSQCGARDELYDLRLSQQGRLLLLKGVDLGAPVPCGPTNRQKKSCCTFVVEPWMLMPPSSKTVLMSSSVMGAIASARCSLAIFLRSSSASLLSSLPWHARAEAHPGRSRARTVPFPAAISSSRVSRWSRSEKVEFAPPDEISGL
jgi:hypothetical protein